MPTNPKSTEKAVGMKPCPFCGETKELWFQRTHPDLSEGHVRCDHCDAQGPEQASQAKADAAWNNRRGVS